MTKKALLIGCNYTGSDAALRGCVNDVKNFKKFLISQGYPEANIRTLTDEPTEQEKKDKEKDKNDKKDKKDKDKKDKDKDKKSSGSKDAQHPTRKNILDGISWLISGAASGDVLFFQFSGHGGQVKDTSGDEDDGIDEVIFPTDFKTAGYIVDDELHDKLVKALPKGVHLNAVLDCCHSGTGLDLPFVYSSKNGKLSKDDKEAKKKKDKEKKEKDKDKKDKKEKDKKDKDKDKDKDKKDKDKDKKDKDKGKDKGKDKDKKDKDKEKKDKKGKGRGSGDTVNAEIVLISGCLDTQTSADTAVGGQATGALTYSVLQVLSKTGGKLSYEELLFQTRDQIKAMNSKIGQIPQLSYNSPDFDVDRQLVL